MKSFFALLLLAVLYSFGCSTQEPKSALIYGINQAPVSLDPATVSDLVYYQIAFNIFETLIAWDWERDEFVPRLAASWQSDSAGLRWTFKLRPGVVFHDGSPFNAEAVKISFERQFDFRSPYFRPGVTDKYGPFAFSMIEEIHAVNDSTVRFILKYPYSSFLDNLATPYFSSIMSPPALKKAGKNFGRQPVGTGPFQFVRWETDRQIMLEKFQRYWSKPAQVDSAIYQIIPSLERKLEMLQTGKLDVISGVSATSVNMLYHQKNVKVVTETLLATAVIGFNCQNHPFDNPNVRRAVAQALDKKSIVFSLSRGLATVAHGPLPPLSNGYNSTLISPAYDPLAAKKLLESSGYPNGLTVKMGFISQTDTLRADPLVVAIQSYLEKIGITVELVRYPDWTTYHAAVFVDGKVHLFREGLPVFNRHPDSFLYSHFHSKSPRNYFHYQNPEVDRWLEQARRMQDQPLRRQLYGKVQEIILRETPAIFLSHPKVVYVTRAGVKNFKIDPLAIPQLNEVSLE